MTTYPIDHYPAVTTPALTDEFIVKQSGITKKAIDIFKDIDIMSPSVNPDTVENRTILDASYMILTQSAAQVKVLISAIKAYLSNRCYGIVFGGYNFSGQLLTCNGVAFNTSTWAAKNDMPSPARSGMGYSKINNKGYSYGGYDGTNSLQDCDEYTLNSSWASKTNLLATRRYLTAVTVLNKGYIYGGANYAVTPIKTCDEYNPDTWTAKADMYNPARYDLAGFSVLDKAYAISGYTGTDLYGSKYVDMYTPGTNVWTYKVETKDPSRQGCCGVEVNNKGYIMGGKRYTTVNSDIDEYDPIANTWMEKCNTLNARAYATAIKYGKAAYLMGGTTGSAYSAGCMKFSPSANTCVEFINMATSRVNHGAVSLHT